MTIEEDVEVRAWKRTVEQYVSDVHRLVTEAASTKDRHKVQRALETSTLLNAFVRYAKKEYRGVVGAPDGNDEGKNGTYIRADSLAEAEAEMQRRYPGEPVRVRFWMWKI